MKKTALMFSMLLAIGAVVLTGCDYKAKKVNTDSGKQVALFTVGDESYTADDLLGLTDKETSYNFLATDDGVNHAYESVYGSLAKLNVERDAVIKQSVENKLDDFDDEVESYANSNSVTVNNARKTKLEELALEDLDDLEEEYYVEEQVEELENMYEDAMFEIDSAESNYKDSMLYRYVANTKPMVVRHILTKVADSSTIYTTGKITEAEVTNLTTVLQRLCLKDTATNSFKNIAIEESEDTSASKGGSCGIVDTYTSFVQPFKLGLYYSEVEQETDATKKAALKEAYGLTADTTKAYADGIDTINIAVIGSVLAGVADDQYETLQKANDHKTESEYDETLYPRNALYNRYLNNSKVHYIGVDCTNLDADIKTVVTEIYPAAEADFIDEKVEACKNTDFYTAIKDCEKVEQIQENDHNIVLAKSEYGFHFMTIDFATTRTTLDEAYAYFRYNAKAKTSGTYVTNTDTTGYTSAAVAKSTRKTEVYDRVYNYIKGGFESKSTNDDLYEYEVYEYYLSLAGGKDFVKNENVYEAIDEKIQLAKEANVKAIEEAREDAWNEYLETIEAYNAMFDCLYPVE